MSETASPTADPVIADLSFEEALRQLQQVVQRLESGDAPLDESIKLYAQGANLRSHCEARLKAAQAQIEAIVLDRDGVPTGTRPFGED